MCRPFTFKGRVVDVSAVIKASAEAKGIRNPRSFKRAPTNVRAFLLVFVSKLPAIDNGLASCPIRSLAVGFRIIDNIRPSEGIV
jgi:hypothetical protein